MNQIKEDIKAILLALILGISFVLILGA